MEIEIFKTWMKHQHNCCARRFSQNNTTFGLQLISLKIKGGKKGREWNLLLRWNSNSYTHIQNVFLKKGTHFVTYFELHTQAIMTQNWFIIIFLYQITLNNRRIVMKWNRKFIQFCLLSFVSTSSSTSNIFHIKCYLNFTIKILNENSVRNFYLHFTVFSQFQWIFDRFEWNPKRE